MGVLDRFKRKTYVDRSDKYLEAALAGQDVLDVTGTFWLDHERDYTYTRLARYKENWRFYKGNHFTSQTLDGKRKLVINLCRPIVNKSVDWLFANGFKFTAPAGNEAIIPLLDMVWNMNSRKLMTWEHGQVGAVSGDAFFYVSVQDRDADGKSLPLEEQKIVIRNLNSAYVHPVYDTADSREMLSCLIQFPTLNVPSSFQNVTKRPLGLYSIVITKKEIVEYWNSSEINGSRRKNFIGRIPVVHTRNIPLANSFFGQSDIDDIIPLNEEYNHVAEDIDSIIKYHAAPTTLIFGARASQLEKGANKVWSGLPKDSRVENLALIGELTAAVAHLDFLKLAIHELSNTPETSLGKVQEISNTSAAALEVQYLPLIEKTKRKYMSYGSSIVSVNEIILMILVERFGLNLSKIVGDESRMYESDVDFISPLPQDKKLQIDLLAAKKKEGLESLAGALRELGEKDPARKVLEILADKRQELAEDTERALAATGIKPLNLSVVNMGSLGVSQPQLQETFAEQDKQMDEALTRSEEEVREEQEELAAQTPIQKPAAPQVTPVKEK